MLIRPITFVAICFIAIATALPVLASSTPSLKASEGSKKGSSSDASETVTKTLASGATVKIKVKAYFQDGLKAVEELSEVDFRKLADAKSLELVQHLDTAAPPMIRRAGHGESATVAGSAAKTIWHSNRGMHNHAIFGPYATLDAGRYLIVYRMMSPKDANGRLASLDVASNANGKASRNVESKEMPTGKWRTFAIPFTFDKKTPRVEYRIYQYGHPLMMDRIYLFKIK